MKLRGLYYFNLLAVLLLVILCASFQTTFWFQMFGHFPAPLIWLNIITFLILYRPPFESIFLIYLIGYILCFFSAIPYSVMSCSLLVLFASIYFTKRRVFWTGSGYFWLASFFSSVAFQIIYLLVSFYLEQQRPSLLILDRMAQTLLTPLFAIPIYKLMQLFDRVFNKDPLSESGAING